MPELSLSRRSLLPLLAIASLTSAINLQLPEVQSIVGFSASCFNAYNTRLPNCSLDDFLGSVGGRNVGCSVSCVSQLGQLQPIVQASCQGERAGRDTVIGQMFLGTVSTFLCGADVGGGGVAPTSSAVTSMSTATTSMSTAAPADSTTTTSESSTTEQSTTTSETSSSATTASPSSTASETLDTTSASSAQPTQTAAANQDGEDGIQTTFGGSGGGSPFDGGPGEFDSAAASSKSQHSILILLGALMLLIR